MVAPKELPKEKPKESDTAVQAIAVAVGGTGNGKMDEAPAAPRDDDESEAPVVAAVGKPSGPVNLPEDADPPVPNEENAQPEYPESARTTGQEAKVVLKIVVEADGRVGRIQVLKGEEPFVSAALSVVRTWTYEPATLDGAPITVFKIVNITFSLRD
jgi:protein TonB